MDLRGNFSQVLLQLNYPGGLQALGRVNEIEFHFLAVGERLVAITLDRREVHEDILARLLLDKAKSLAVVEPLYRSLSHGRHTPFSSR